MESGARDIPEVSKSEGETECVMVVATAPGVVVALGAVIPKSKKGRS